MGSVTIFQVVEAGETVASIKSKLDKLDKSPPTFKTVPGAQGEDVKLATTITNVSGRPLGGQDAVSGLFKYQDVSEANDIDGVRHTQMKTYTIQFAFIPDPLRLLIFKGAGARAVAARMSSLVYNQSDDPILACRIHPHQLTAFMAEHAHELRSCALSNLSMPGVKKVRLAGMRVEDDPGYQRYDGHGEKDSIQVYLPATGMHIAVNGSASVRFYRNLEIDEQIEFLREYILDMCT